MVDVPPPYAGLLAERLAEEGWKVEMEHADGADALSAALHRRGWTRSGHSSSTCVTASTTMCDRCSSTSR